MRAKKTKAKLTPIISPALFHSPSVSCLIVLGLGSSGYQVTCRRKSEFKKTKREKEKN